MLIINGNNIISVKNRKRRIGLAYIDIVFGDAIERIIYKGYHLQVLLVINIASSSIRESIPQMTGNPNGFDDNKMYGRR